MKRFPGVESAGSTWGPPLGRSMATGKVLVEGRPEAEPGEEHDASIHSMGPGYLETMRIAIVRGRGLLPSDDFGSVSGSRSAPGARAFPAWCWRRG